MQIWEHSVQIGRISIKMTLFCVITRIKLETWNLVNLQIKILQKTFKASRNKIFLLLFIAILMSFFYFFLFLLQFWWFLPRRVYSVCGIVQNFCWDFCCFGIILLEILDYFSFFGKNDFWGLPRLFFTIFLIYKGLLRARCK